MVWYGVEGAQECARLGLCGAYAEEVARLFRGAEVFGRGRREPLVQTHTVPLRLGFGGVEQIVRKQAGLFAAAITGTSLS